MYFDLDADIPYLYGRRKHGVAFEAARRVFKDDFAVEWPDSDVPYGEKRFVITGIVDGRLLRVVYTERNDRIRIISARRATRHERREYYHSQGDG